MVVTTADLLSVWHPDASIIVGIALLVALYMWRWRAVLAHDPAGAPDPVQRRRFYAALAILLIAVASPLHELSDTFLFSAHMLQHLLLIMAFPPLILSSITAAMVRPLTSGRFLRPIARTLTNPVMAFGLCNLIFALSHIPSFYNAVLENHGIHIFEHLAFIVTAVILWWPVFSPLPELPRLGYPLQMLYLFLQTIPGSLVGSFVANARQALYPFYVNAPRMWGLTPLADQQIGAIIMWVGGGTIFLVACAAVFFVWFNYDERESRREREKLTPRYMR